MSSAKFNIINSTSSLKINNLSNNNIDIGEGGGDLNIFNDSINLNGVINTKLVVDITDTAALTVRKNDNTGDVFNIDTTNNNVEIISSQLNISGTSQGIPEISGVFLNANNLTFLDNTTVASGTADSLAFHSFSQPSLSATNSSVITTNAVNLYIEGPPLASTNQTITNSYALWIGSGITRLDDDLRVLSSTVSTSPTTGSIITNGGVAISNTTDSVSIANGGALTVAGGAAIAKKVYIGGDMDVAGTTTFGGVNNISGVIVSTNTAASTSTTTGAVQLSGGIGIANVTNAVSSLNGGSFTTAGGAAIAQDLYVGGNLNIAGSTTGIIHDNLQGLLDDDHTQYALLVGRSGGQILTGGAASGNSLTLRSTSNATKGRVFIDETTASTSVTTGALVVSGGVGIGGDLNAKSVASGQIMVATDLSSMTSPYVEIGEQNGPAYTVLENTTDLKFSSFNAPRYDMNSFSVDKAATVYIEGAPQDPNDFFLLTQNYALYVASGQTKLDSVVTSVLDVEGVAIFRNVVSFLNEETSFLSINVTSELESSSTITGAAVIRGGIGIVKNVNIGGNLNIAGSTTGIIHDNLQGLLDDDHTQYALLAGRTGGQILTGGAASGNSLTLRSTSNATKGRVIIDETTASTNASSGALVVTGGVGIGGDLNVDGVSSFFNAGRLRTTFSEGANYIQSGSVGYTTSSAPFRFGQTLNAAFWAELNSIQLNLTQTTGSSSTTTGALRVAGGAGIGQNLNVGGNVAVSGTDSSFSVNRTSIGDVFNLNESNKRKIILSRQLLSANPNDRSILTVTGGFECVIRLSSNRLVSGQRYFDLQEYYICWSGDIRQTPIISSDKRIESRSPLYYLVNTWYYDSGNLSCSLETVRFTNTDVEIMYSIEGYFENQPVFSVSTSSPSGISLSSSGIEQFNENLILNGSVNGLDTEPIISGISGVSNVSTVSQLNSKLVKIGDTRNLCATFQVEPILSGTYTTFNFDIPELSLIPNKYSLIGSIQGFNDATDIPLNNMNVVGDVSSGKALVKFASSSLDQHIIQININYSCVKGRFFTFGQFDGKNQRANIFEFEVYDENGNNIAHTSVPSGTNVATGSVFNLIDKNNSTDVSTSFMPNQRFTLDFGKEIRVSKVVIVNREVENRAVQARLRIQDNDGLNVYYSPQIPVQLPSYTWNFDKHPVVDF